jgi:hypothetical protein
MATNLEIFILFLAFVGLALLMASFFKSKDIYKALYTKTNTEEINKNYDELISKLKKENNPKQRKVLNKEIRKLLYYFDLGDDDDKSAISGNYFKIISYFKGRSSSDLHEYLLTQLRLSFNLGVSGFILVFISIVVFEIKIMVIPTPERIIGMALLFSLFFFVFLSIKFDNRKKVVYIFIAITIIVFIAALYLLWIGLHD